MGELSVPLGIYMGKKSIPGAMALQESLTSSLFLLI